jgi:hypothetical protein
VHNRHSAGNIRPSGWLLLAIPPEASIGEMRHLALIVTVSVPGVSTTAAQAETTTPNAATTAATSAGSATLPIKLIFTGDGFAQHTSTVSPPGLGLPASARVQMNWSLTWVLDNAPLQNEARPPKLMAGTFFPLTGSETLRIGA